MSFNFSKFIAVITLSTTTSLSFANDEPKKLSVDNQDTLGSSAIYQTLLNNYAIKKNKRRTIRNKRRINRLTERLESLELTPPTSQDVENSITLSVDCATETISDVLSSAPTANNVTLEISGSCTDNLVITRDNVTLIGTGSDDSIAYNGVEINSNEYRESITNTITIIGADNIVIDNLTISDALTNGFSTGLRLLNGAGVLLRNSVVENTVIPIWASHASTIQMNDNIIQDNFSYSLLITDGAVAELRGNNDLSGDNSVAGLGVYRSGTVRIQEGENSIGSNNSDAIQAFHGSQIRSERGTLTVNGSIIAGLLSQVDLRDTTVNGDITVGAQSVVNLSARGFESTVDVNGDITVNNLGYLGINPRFPNTSTVDGSIFCNGFGAVANINLDPNFVTILGDNDLNGNCN